MQLGWYKDIKIESRRFYSSTRAQAHTYTRAYINTQTTHTRARTLTHSLTNKEDINLENSDEQR